MGGSSLDITIALLIVIWIRHGFAHLRVRRLRAVDEAENARNVPHGFLLDALKGDFLLSPSVLHALQLGTAAQDSIGGVDFLLQCVALPLQSRVAPRALLAAPDVLVDIRELIAQTIKVIVIAWDFHGGQKSRR